MANEFIIKNGFFSQGSSNITGSLALSGAVSTVGQGYFNQGVWSMVYANLFGAEVFRVTYTTNNFLLGTTTDSGYRLNVNGSSGFNGNAAITGSLIVTGNLNVIGTSSFTYTTASIVQVGSNIITLNTNNPATRFGGITVVDSGSFGTSSTGSIFWDSLNNKWIYSNPSGSSYSGGMLISGPRNTSSLGNEEGTLNNYITKGQGGDHITSSMMYEDSSNNIGIGTITPRTKFDVNGGDATIRTAFIGTIASFGDNYTTFSHLNRTGSGDYSFLSDKDGLTYINAKAGTDIHFRIDNIDKVNIDSSGNVGIGTTTPAAKLDVNGNTVITGSLLVYGSSLVAGYNPTPLAGTIKDGVTSVLGNLQDWNTNYYQGEVLYSETAGNTIAFGQICYRTTSGTWLLADATAIGSTSKHMLGICVKSSTASNPTSILIKGFVQTTYVTSNRIGEPIHLDTTAGSMTNAAPSTAGNIVRLVGHTLWTTAGQSNGVYILHFNPDSTWIEL